MRKRAESGVAVGRILVSPLSGKMALSEVGAGVVTLQSSFSAQMLRIDFLVCIFCDETEFIVLIFPTALP